MTVTECSDVALAEERDPAPAAKVRIEVAVNESFLQPTLEALRSAGSLSDDEQSGFGKIFVSELLDVVRIRTGERGPDAI